MPVCVSSCNPSCTLGIDTQFEWFSFATISVTTNPSDRLYPAAMASIRVSGINSTPTRRLRWKDRNINGRDVLSQLSRCSQAASRRFPSGRERRRYPVGLPHCRFDSMQHATFWLDDAIRFASRCIKSDRRRAGSQGMRRVLRSGLRPWRCSIRGKDAAFPFRGGSKRDATLMHRSVLCYDF
jgi:hypothetical protein